MSGLKGKAAVVTGGASGIGFAIAERLVAEGCRVGIVDLQRDRTEAAAARLSARSAAQAFGAAADVSLPQEMAKAKERLVGALGAIDILANSAGILRVGQVLHSEARDWSEMFQVNVVGALNACQSIVPAMVARGRGKVINIASWLGKQGMRNYGGYCASKFALIGLTQTLALEVAESGVCVNAICPGTIMATGMREEAEAIHRRLGLPSAEERVGNIPMRRLGTPRDIARVAVFLASEESDYVTGQAINVCGGLWLH